MTAPALPGAAPDPAPGRNDPARLPPEVERAIGKCCDAHGAYATARERGTIPQIDKAFKAAESAEAALRTAIRAALDKRGEVSAASAASARALGGDGEPVAASVDAALAALDVEPTHHPDRMVTTYDILGLDAVRAAHRAEVERAVAEEREACAKVCEEEMGGDDEFIAGCDASAAAIRARGAKS